MDLLRLALQAVTLRRQDCFQRKTVYFTLFYLISVRFCFDADRCLLPAAGTGASISPKGTLTQQWEGAGATRRQLPALHSRSCANAGCSKLPSQVLPLHLIDSTNCMYCHFLMAKSFVYK